MANSDRCCVCASKEHTDEDCHWVKKRNDIARLTQELVNHAKAHGPIGTIALANAFFELHRQKKQQDSRLVLEAVMAEQELLDKANGLNAHEQPIFS